MAVSSGRFVSPCFVHLGAIWFLALLFSTGGCTAPRAEPVLPSVSAGKNALPLFAWEICAADLPGRVTLLGSVHFLRGGELRLDPALESAFEAADRLVVEIDLLSIRPEEQQRLVQRYAMLPPGETLEQRLPPETVQRLREALTKHGVAFTAVQSMKPWMAALVLTELEFKRIGLDPELGVDRYFLRRAQGRKPVVSLETLELQLSLLDGLTPKLQELVLLDVLAQSDKRLAEVEEMLAAWKNGDPDALNKAVFRALEEHPEFAPFYERTFFERNRSMAERIEKFLAQGGRWFVIVGAGHLVGEKGVLALLKQRGYLLNQLQIYGE